MVSQVNMIWAALVGIAPGSEFLTAANLSTQVSTKQLQQLSHRCAQCLVPLCTQQLCRGTAILDVCRQHDLDLLIQQLSGGQGAVYVCRQQILCLVASSI